MPISGRRKRPLALPLQPGLDLPPLRADAQSYSSPELCSLDSFFHSVFLGEVTPFKRNVDVSSVKLNFVCGRNKKKLNFVSGRT
jgi:hypothetical protein